MATPAYLTHRTPNAASGSLNVIWPTHAAGDLGLLIIQTCGGQPVPATPSGWTTIANSPQATGAGTAGSQLTVFYRFATSSAEPNVPTGDSGDHQFATIATFSDVATTGDPWDVTAGDVKASASTSLSFPSVTTTGPDRLVVLIGTCDLDSAASWLSGVTNATLASITERFDGGTTIGVGGGIAIVTAVKSSSGSTGATSATVTSSVNAVMTIALRSDDVGAPAFNALMVAP